MKATCVVLLVWALAAQTQIDLRTQAKNATPAGIGLTVANGTVSVDTASVPTFLAGSAALSFPPIAAQSCAEQSFSLPGLAVGATIAPGWPQLPDGIAGSMYASAAGILTVRLCNVTTTIAVILSPAVFRAASIASF